MAYALTMSKNRMAINFLGAAILLLLLGMGNVIYGQIKHSEYLDLLSEAQAGLTSPQPSVPLPVPGPTVTLDQQIQQLNRIRARVDFYALVVMGGKFFLLGSVVFLVLFLTALRREKLPAPGK